MEFYTESEWLFFDRKECLEYYLTLGMYELHKEERLSTYYEHKRDHTT